MNKKIFPEIVKIMTQTATEFHYFFQPKMPNDYKTKIIFMENLNNYRLSLL